MKRMWKSAAMALGVLLLCGGAFFLGRLTAREEPSVTFYGEILSREGDFFHVEGLDVNDVNHRGEFTFTFSGGAGLKAGDPVAVTYDGYVQETYPAQLPNVLRIRLLDE